VNEHGYFYDGKFIQQRFEKDAWGYAGVVVYINMMGGYDAYDLCCPNCVYERQACKVDGPFATCPLCGEQYTLGDGTAAPNKGIATEQLRRLNVMNSGGRLTITQRQ
jgi:nitrite reductase/ring-hydroxylating ferredoxin subunit